MRLNFVSILFCLALISCSSQELPDVFRTKSGLFGSREGKFLAEFPGKPGVFPIHYQMGNIEYDEYAFRYRVANEYLYHISYLDAPTTLLKAWDIEQLFDQTIKSMSSNIENFIVQEKVVNEDSGYEKCITYILYPSIRGNNSYMKARLIKHGNRIYSIFFACSRRIPELQEIDNFLDSFKFYRSKSN